MTANNLYESFLSLSLAEQHDFLSRIKTYEKQVVAHTSDGNPLTRNQYLERINEGIRQCATGKCKSLKQLCEDLDYNYAEL